MVLPSTVLAKADEVDEETSEVEDYAESGKPPLSVVSSKPHSLIGFIDSFVAQGSAVHSLPPGGSRPIPSLTHRKLVDIAAQRYGWEYHTKGLEASRDCRYPRAKTSRFDCQPELGSENATARKELDVAPEKNQYNKDKGNQTKNDCL